VAPHVPTGARHQADSPGDDMVTETLRHSSIRTGNDQDFSILAIISRADPGCVVNLHSSQCCDGVARSKSASMNLHSVGVSEQTAPGRDSPPLR